LGVATFDLLRDKQKQASELVVLAALAVLSKVDQNNCDLENPQILVSQSTNLEDSNHPFRSFLNRPLFLAFVYFLQRT